MWKKRLKWRKRREKIEECRRLKNRAKLQKKSDRSSWTGPAGSEQNRFAWTGSVENPPFLCVCLLLLSPRTRVALSPSQNTQNPSTLHRPHHLARSSLSTLSSLSLSLIPFQNQPTVLPKPRNPKPPQPTVSNSSYSTPSHHQDTSTTFAGHLATVHITRQHTTNRRSRLKGFGYKRRKKTPFLGLEGQS